MNDALTDFKSLVHQAFRVIQIHHPEVVIFAILADPKGVPSEEIIRLILERLFILKEDMLASRKFLNQLLMLSVKRNLQPKIYQQMEKMDDFQEYELDYFYMKGEKKGMEKGIEKGMEKGIEKGIEEGLEKGKEESHIIAIRNMLAKGFDLSVIADILEVTEEYVLAIKNQLAKESEIVARLKRKTASSSIARTLKVSPLLVEVIKKEYGL